MNDQEIRLSRLKVDDRGLRLRVPKHRTHEILPKHYETSRQPFKHLLPTSSSFYITVLCFLVLVYIIIVEMEKRLPTPLLLVDEQNNPGRFIAERARNHVLNLTSLGPHPTGSFENEVLAVNFLSREINSIITKANKVHKVSMDIQKTSGSFPLDFLDKMTNVYKNVQNVIVKIGAYEESPHSLLINCHFDTVQDSPGGSDDGASCAVMLEILRVISLRDVPLVHNIIFLFNGAEENMLQASHGFITQHKWAKEVRAFINLEACGAGGRELLFQAGPEHPWLMEAYSQSVPYPLASALAEEIFQSGIIPGDTDYRIFRDFGQISGLDFAWSSNGYVYHTRLDNAAQIPLGTLQRTGDNILALAFRLASAPQMYNTSMHRSGNLVYFDVLGAFIVHSSEPIAHLFNLIIVLLSLTVLFWEMNDAKTRGIPNKIYLNQLLICAVTTISSWLLSVASSAVIAFVLTSLNRAMSWYSRPAWIFFLYVVPTMFVSLTVILMSARKQRNIIHSPWQLYRLYYNGSQAIFTVAVIIAIIFRIRSGFIPGMWVLFSSLGTVLQNTLFIKWKDWRWLVLHVGILLLPYIQCGYMVNGALLLVVPIMGRSGAGNHAEHVLSLIATAMFALLLSFIVPVILLVKNHKRVLSFLAATFLVSVLTLVLTPLGFPYSSDPLSPSPQRHMILHVDRQYHSLQGSVREHHYGYWVINLDVNSPHTVSALVPEMSRAQLIQEECDRELYCGLPYLIPVITFIWQTHWIPGPPPSVSIKTELQLMSRENKSNGTVRLTFSAVGPDHMTLLVSPNLGVKLAAWSLVPGTPLKGRPKWKNRDTYFVYYSCASDPEPWLFWIDLQPSEDHKTSLLEVALSGHFIHGAQQTSVRLQQLLSQFPPWTVTSGWTALFRSYTF